MKHAAILVAAAIVLGAYMVYAGLIFQPEDPPEASPLFSVSILPASDTDRTETNEIIDASGHKITWVMNDANADALGDATIDLRVVNENRGAGPWPFEISLKFVDFTFGTSPTAQPILNRTFIGGAGERYDVTYTAVDSGKPTLFQDGERAFSNDWEGGLADTVRIVANYAPTAMDDLGAGASARVEWVVGGVTITAEIRESV